MHAPERNGLPKRRDRSSILPPARIQTDPLPRIRKADTASLHACRRAGVRYRAPTHFRHTYAHRMLSAGENLAAIRAELGHKDVAVTARVYAGFLAELKGCDFGFLAAERYAGRRS